MSSGPDSSATESPLEPLPILLTENEDGIAAGETPGYFQVTQDGAATYRIPLWVPPGRNGMQPDLALQYDSRVGAGPMGVGWRLDGLSKISRGEKNFSNDGRVGAVNFDDFDAFYLDGERLVQVVGNVARDGAEYRTRHNSFSRIVIQGYDEQSSPEQTSGPQTFRVYEKGGRILTFEADPLADSRVNVAPVGSNPNPNDVQQQSVRYSWSLRSVIDRTGNAIYIQYTSLVNGNPSELYPPGMGEFLPYRILYTGSINNDELQPLRSVVLVYGGHPEARVGYISGLQIRQSSRLERIEMWGPNPINVELLRLYEITYRNDSITGRSLVSTIRECDGWPTTPAIEGEPVPGKPPFEVKLGVCKRPHVFNWELGALGFQDHATRIVDIKTAPRDAADLPSRILPIDLNADGVDDIFYVPATTPDKFAFRLADLTGIGFGPANHTDIGVARDLERHKFPWGTLFEDADLARALEAQQNPLDYEPQPIDLDMDGRMDVITADSTVEGDDSVSWEFKKRVSESIVDKTSGATVLSPIASLPYQFVVVADVDGDRWPEVLSLAEGVWSVSPDAKGSDPSQTQWPVGLNRPLVLDINGDGAMELLFPLEKGKWKNRLGAFSVDKFGQSSPDGDATNLFSDRDYIFADLNGDGLVDAVASNPTGDGLHTCAVAINTGNGFLPDAVQESTLNFKDASKRVLSYHADGKQDILLRWAHGARDESKGAPIVLLHWEDERLNATILPIETAPATDDELELFEVGDFNGDGLDDLIMMSEGQLHLYIHAGRMPDMLTEISDTLGCRTWIRYEPVTNADVYKRTQSCIYPLYATTRGRWVVAEVSAENGTGSSNRYRYAYEDGRTDLRGQGFLGFLKVHVTDANTGVTTDIGYNQLETPIETPITFATPAGKGSLFPYAGLPTDVATSTPLDTGASHVHRIQTLYEHSMDASGLACFVYASQSGEEETEEPVAGPSVPISGITTYQQFDDYGNLLSQDIRWKDGGSISYRATYDKDVDHWLVGMLTFAELTSVTPDGIAPDDQAVQRVAREYDADGQLIREIIEPGARRGQTGYDPLPPQTDGVQTLYVTYSRGKEGLVEHVTLEETTEPIGNKRAFSYTFDPTEHMYPIAVVNSLGHRLRTSFHPGWGIVSVFEDENGLKTTFQHDGFGRSRHASAPGGYKLQMFYAKTFNFPASAPRVAVSGVVRQDIAETELVTAYDILGRPVLTWALARDDKRPVVREIAYDDRGRIRQLSRGHFDTDPPAYSTYSYDLLGRLRSERRADGTLIGYEYDGRQLTVTSPRGQRRLFVFDELGRIAQAVENGAAPLTTGFYFGPLGQVTRVVDAAGHGGDWRYDRLGRLIQESDPDSGRRSLTYSTFGEIVGEDRGGLKVAFEYDAIGRLARIHSPEGETRYEWDTAPHGVGALARITTPDRVTLDYRYDSLGRLSAKRWELVAGAFTIGFKYDPAGRISSLVYPAATTGKPTFEVRYAYGNYGALVSIADGRSGQPFWTRLNSDASGQFGRDEVGNGVVSERIEDPARPGFLQAIVRRVPNGPYVQNVEYQADANLNIVSRVDHIARLKESFEYDRLDRMTAWRRTGHSTAGVPWNRSITWQYDDIGNIRKRQTHGGADFVYEYGHQGAGIHGVDATSLGQYRYDQRGNQIEAPGRVVKYTSFDLPREINAAGQTFSLQYDGEGRRAQKSGPGGAVAVFIGGLYEAVLGEFHKFFVVGPHGIIGEVIWSQAGKSIVREEVLYLHAGHLGSIELVTDPKGDVVEAPHYEPFGLRDDPNDPGIKPKPDGRVDLGFNGHRQDDLLKLIDMGARWYDPVTGRFLSPDPLRPSIFSGQALNPYSYAYNNPLSWRDPTGLQPEDTDDEDWDYSTPGYRMRDVTSPTPGMPLGSMNGSPVAWGAIIEKLPDPASQAGNFADRDTERANFTSAGTVPNPQGRGAGIRDVSSSGVAAPAGFGSLGGSALQVAHAMASGSPGRGRNRPSGWWLGTEYGHAAAEWYAAIVTNPGARWYEKSMAYLGGSLAALWTPPTWKQTASILLLASALGGSLARPSSQGRALRPRDLIQGANSREKFFATIRLLSSRTDVDAAQKVQMVLEHLREISFYISREGVVDEGPWFLMRAEKGEAAYRFIKDSGKILYGKFDQALMDYVWTEL